MAKTPVTLNWKHPVQEATFLRRYKRFFADVQLKSGETVVAHVPNSGSMKSCNTPDSPCLISFNNDPARKLKYTLEAIASAKGWIGVNTSYPNALAEQAFLLNLFPRWHAFNRSAREVKISDHSRTDLVLWTQGKEIFERPSLDQIKSKKGTRLHFVEVKNVSLALDTCALFPDSVTERGLKHVIELEALIKLGHTAEFLFVIQRTDVDHFSAAAEIDPQYAKALMRAKEKGLVVSPHIVEVTPAGFVVRAEPIRFLLA